MTILANQSMTKNLIVVHFSDTLETSYEKMLSAGIRHLPVVDDGNKIVGIISDRDFKRAEWPTSSTPQQKPNFKASSIVGDYMSWPVTWADYDSSLGEVAQKMIDNKISAVLIQKDNKPIGIVTHEDLLKVLISTLRSSENPLERLKQWAYNSPIGQIATSLAEIGI